MAGGWKTVDDKTVLAYLKSKRAALDQAIAALEGKLGGSAEAAGGGGGENIESDSFVGLNIATASVRYLQMVGRPARTTEDVHNALAKGGLPHFTRESVATILQRMHNQGGDIVKVSKGVWGLAEWYPNRPKPIKRRSQGEAEEKESLSEKEKQRPTTKKGKSKKADRTHAAKAAKAQDVKVIAVKWLRLLRDAGGNGITTPRLAAGLGYDSGRSVPFLAIQINKILTDAKMEPKTIYEGKRVDGEQRWFAKEKIEEALKLMKG